MITRDSEARFLKMHREETLWIILSSSDPHKRLIPLIKYSTSHSSAHAFNFLYVFLETCLQEIITLKVYLFFKCA